MSRNIPIFIQLISGISAIIIVVMFVTGFWFYRDASQVVLENSTRYLLDSVVQMRGKTDVMLKEYDRLSQQIGFNPLIQNHLRNIKKQRETEFNGLEINQLIREQSRFVGTEFLIHLFDSEGGMYWGNELLALSWRSWNEVKNLPWYSQIARNEGRTMWIYGPAWLFGRIDAIIGIRQLNDWEQLEPLGDLFMVIPINVLQEIIEGTELNSRKIQVFDHMGQIVYSTEPNEIGQLIHAELYDKFNESPNDIFQWGEGDDLTYVSYSVSEYSGWTFTAFIDPDVALSDLSKIRQNAWLIGFLGIVAAFLLVSFFSWTLVRPIRYLATRLTRVQKGLLMPYKAKFMNREAHILYTSFNNMVMHLDEIILDLSEKRISEKKAQINALKSQFNPHFLYNTLNTIYWNVVNEGNDNAAKMVLTLSELLRYSISPGSELVAVRDDLEQLKRYITLQQSRYGDKLQVHIDVDHTLMEKKMLKLLLQPLVENAIAHGLEPVKRQQWLIKVEIRASDQGLLFTVDDNGIGMAEHQRRQIFSSARNFDEPKAMHSGLGLVQLHERIKLHFGREYGVSLAESPLGGLRVKVRLPIYNHYRE